MLRKGHEACQIDLVRNLKGDLPKFCLADQLTVICEISAHNLKIEIMRTDFIEHRKLINKANFWKVIFQFWLRYLKLLDPNPERILQWMMSTGELISHDCAIVTVLFVLCLLAVCCNTCNA